MNLILVSRVQGNSVRRTYIRDQRMERRHRVSENKMGEVDYRAFGCVIKEEVSTGTLRENLTPPGPSPGRGDMRKEHSPGLVSIAPTS